MLIDRSIRLNSCNNHGINDHGILLLFCFLIKDSDLTKCAHAKKIEGTELLLVGRQRLVLIVAIFVFFNYDHSKYNNRRKKRTKYCTKNGSQHKNMYCTKYTVCEISKKAPGYRSTSRPRPPPAPGPKRRLGTPAHPPARPCWRRGTTRKPSTLPFTPTSVGHSEVW